MSAHDRERQTTGLTQRGGRDHLADVAGGLARGQRNDATNGGVDRSVELAGECVFLSLCMCRETAVSVTV